MSALHETLRDGQSELIEIDGTHFAQSYFCRAESPLFAGHFPNNPVLPAVTEMLMVCLSIEKALQKKVVLQEVKQAKIYAAVGADTTVHIVLEARADGFWKAQLTVEEKVVAFFVLRVEVCAEDMLG